MVRLFTPDADRTWLLTELDRLEPDVGFRICDLGMDWPELGNVRITPAERVRGASASRSKWTWVFTAKRRISKCAQAAHLAGRIVA